MIYIKSIDQDEYLIMDSILIILNEKGGLPLNTLQYELLKCGIRIKYQLLSQAFNELIKHRAVSKNKTYEI